MKRIQIADDENHRSKVVITPPKSRKSERTIPLHPDILLLLKNMKGDNDTFFLTGSKTVYVKPRTMQNCFKKIIQEVGITDMGFHGLRHTFATKSIVNGMDPKVLSEIMGHASVKLTLDRYVHPSEKQKKRTWKCFPDSWTGSQVANFK